MECSIESNAKSVKKQQTNNLGEALAESFSSGVVHSIAIDSLGRISGDDESSRSIRSEDDFHWFITLRNRADLIITSGRTYRAEKYNPSKHAPIEVITREPIPAVAANDEQFGITFTSLEDAVKRLRKSNRVLLESGPNLAATLVNEGQAVQVALSFPQELSTPEAYMFLCERFGYLSATPTELANCSSRYSFESRAIVFVPLMRRA